MKKPLIPAFLAVATASAPALDFLTVTDIATPNMTSGSPSFPLSNVIQGPGVGFDAAEPHNNIGSVWYTDAPGGFPSDYISVNPGDEIVILDLGEDKSLYELSFWGYSSGNENGMREFEVRFATDAEGGAPGLGDEAFGSSISDVFSFEAILDPNPRQSFGFGKEIVARYVEVKALSTFFDIVPGIAGGDRLGLGEISFAEPSATGAPDVVPTEPQTLDLQSADPLLVPVYNTGDSDLSVSAVNFTGANAAAFSLVTTLPAAIGPFIEGPIEIDFDPTGLGGPIEATMVVTTNDPDQPSIEISLSGSLPALGPDLIVTSPATLVLAETGVQSFNLSISNGGGSALTITAVTPTGADSGAVSVTSFPPTIEVGATADIVIAIDPLQAGPGALDVTLEIASDDESDPTTPLVIDAGLPVAFSPVAAVFANDVFANYFATNLIQGIGVGFETGWPHNGIGSGPAATWVTEAPNGAGDYYDNGISAPVIIFDLGADVAIGEINTWGYAAGNTNGGKDYTLRFATESEGGGITVGGPDFNLVEFQENFADSISYQPSFEADFSPALRDTEVFEEPVVARYVEMVVTDNWRGLVDSLPGGDRVGFGEVAFPVYDGPLTEQLGIVAAERLANGDFSVTFFSTPGVDYEMERSTDGLTWDRLPISVPGSPGETTTILDTDTLPDTEKRVLYRVVRP
jgi:hypothetical protein